MNWNTKDLWNKYSTYIWMGLHALAIILLFDTWGVQGLYGYGVVVAIIVTLILVFRWKQYVQTMQYIESLFLGKPIMAHTKEELKNKSIKINWRSKNGDT